jgi:hypothetical protein
LTICQAYVKIDIAQQIVVYEEYKMKKIELISMVKILKVAAVSLFVLSNVCCEGISFTEFAQSTESQKSIVAQVIVNRQSISPESFTRIITQLNKKWTYKDVRDNWNVLSRLSSENVDTIGVREGYVMSEEARAFMEHSWKHLRTSIQLFAKSCGNIDGIPDSRQLPDPLNARFFGNMMIGVSIARMLAKLEANEADAICEIRRMLAMEHAPEIRACAEDIVINILKIPRPAS